MAAAVAVFAFVFGGCEDLNDAVRRALDNGQKKTAKVADAAQLAAALQDPEVTEINITDHINGGELSLDVPAGYKTIYIPGDRETALKSLALAAGSHVTIRNADEEPNEALYAAALGAVMNEASYAGWATLVIWDNFKIPDGATFDLIGSVRLIFRTSATVEVNDTGKLTGDAEGSIVWHGE
jgi:hypothetical protein